MRLEVIEKAKTQPIIYFKGTTVKHHKIIITESFYIKACIESPRVSYCQGSRAISRAATLLVAMGTAAGVSRDNQ
jgi:hypothetical protein